MRRGYFFFYNKVLLAFTLLCVAVPASAAQFQSITPQKQASVAKAIGKLKIPGFSTYIHKLDNNHLLTIGQDADPRTGRPKGLKLSVFDVSNFKKPREVKSLLFNSKASSEASYEHKAFTFYAEKGILAIPVHGKGIQRAIRRASTQQSQQSSLLLFKVSKDNIVPHGEMNLSDMALNLVRRSFFADDIVYAISNGGIRAAHLKKPSQALSTVFFHQQVAKFW